MAGPLYAGSSISPESDPPSPFLPPQECGTLRGSLSSEWSDTVIDGKGMLHGLEIEIGRLLVYAVWSVQTATAIFAIIRFFLFFAKKKHVDMNF